MKERYIKHVKKELHLPREAKNEVLRDLNEIFASAVEHGETEQQVIERLGTPKEFADSTAEQFGVDNKKKRRVVGAAIIVAAVIILIVIMGIWSPVVFQRGNPIPYLVAAIRISDENPYVQVETDSGADIYIAKRGDCPKLFEYIEESRNVEFIEQAGSGYIFSNGIDGVVVSSEVYLSKFTVWSVPTKTLACD